VAVSAALAIVLVVGGIAWATIPGSDGTISACYGKRTGLVRIYDPSGSGLLRGCLANEVPISWNQAGPTGATGDPGPKGDQGPADVDHAYFATCCTTPVTLSTIFAQVARIDNLPAGNYVMSAKVTLTVTDGPATADCLALLPGIAPVDESQQELIRTAVSIPLAGVAQLASAGSILLECNTNDQATVRVANAQLVATAVDAVN
jgi:hypothetical protein